MRFCLWIGHSGTSAVIAEQFGIGDDALVLPDTARVDLGDHQRHVRVHAEGRGIVDHDRASLDGSGCELPGDVAARREQRDVDTLKGLLSELLDHDPLTAEVDGLAGRAGAGQRLELADREGALVHGGDEFGANSAGYAGNGYNGFVTHGSVLLVRASMLRAIKKPRSFSGGASVQIMRSFDYARTAPEPPEGALVFAVALVEVVMARTYAEKFGRRQRFWG